MVQPIRKSMHMQSKLRAAMADSDRTVHTQPDGSNVLIAYSGATILRSGYSSPKTSLVESRLLVVAYRRFDIATLSSIILPLVAPALSKNTDATSDSDETLPS